jgi:hypothetical protein
LWDASSEPGEWGEWDELLCRWVLAPSTREEVEEVVGMVMIDPRPRWVVEVDDKPTPAPVPALVPRAVPAAEPAAAPRAVGEPDAQAVAVAEAVAEAVRWAESWGAVCVMSAEEPGKPPAYSSESICSHGCSRQ